jgi:hypothetical protein
MSMTSIITRKIHIHRDVIRGRRANFNIAEGDGYPLGAVL